MRLHWYFPKNLRLRLLAMGVIFCCADRMQAGNSADSTEAWRAERAARLSAPDGWLSLIGLHWFQPKENRLPFAVRAGEKNYPGEAH